MKFKKIPPGGKRAISHPTKGSTKKILIPQNQPLGRYNPIY